MDFTLTSGSVVSIRDRATLTQRMARPVEVAQARFMSVSQKLISVGFDDTKPETWALASDLTPDEFQRLDDVKCAVIVAMVETWPFPQSISLDGVLDLVPDDFEELSSACSLAFQGESFEPDPDPKVDTSDSPA